MDKAKAGLGFFERYLSLWVALCIIVGIALGAVMPTPFRLLGEVNLAKVNLPVALLIWLMIIPMLLRVDFGAIAEVGRHWRGILVTVGVNWLVKPFSMALLGWRSADQMGTSLGTDAGSGGMTSPRSSA